MQSHLVFPRLNVSFTSTQSHIPAVCCKQFFQQIVSISSQIEATRAEYLLVLFFLSIVCASSPHLLYRVYTKSFYLFGYIYTLHGKIESKVFSSTEIRFHNKKNCIFFFLFYVFYLALSFSGCFYVVTIKCVAANRIQPTGVDRKNIVSVYSRSRRSAYKRLAHDT